MPTLRAFTLLELSVVLVIIAISAAVAIPRFANSTARYRVDSAAARLKADLDLARESAVQRSRSITVALSRALRHEYTIQGVADLKKPSINYNCAISDEPYNATIAAFSLGGDNAIIFDGFGMPDSAGSITLTVGSQSRTISIDANSGAVSISTP